MDDMVKSEENASGFATIALENHWSPWFIKWQIELLGFKAINSIKVKHKSKHPEQSFAIHLMWMPKRQNAEMPTMDWQKLLDGETFCTAHPLYRPRVGKTLYLNLQNDVVTLTLKLCGFVVFKM